MGIVNELTAAASRLEWLHRASTQGVWRRGTGRSLIEAGRYDDVVVPGPVECMSYCYGGTSTIDGDNLDADMNLVVALHTGAQPMIAILRKAAEDLAAYTDPVIAVEQHGLHADAIAFARAVNAVGVH